MVQRNYNNRKTDFLYYFNLVTNIQIFEYTLFQNGIKMNLNDYE